MSVTTEKLAYLQGTKDEIRNAIIEKGVDVSTSDTFRSYAGSIRKISTGGVRSCRFVIGTSTAGWTEKDCDYLCDGVDDQVEINAAIQALPSTGGEIKVLDGTYNITSSINIDKERVTFGGCGQSTIFKRMFKGSLLSDAVIKPTQSYCTFKDFAIDGNRSIYAGGSGIWYYVQSNSSPFTDVIMDSIYINNNEKKGLYLKANNSIVTNSTFINNHDDNIHIVRGINNKITNNFINGDSDFRRTGIYMDYGDENVVSGNFVTNCSIGISIYYEENDVIIGNYSYGNNTGIYATYAKNCTITGNTCNNNSSRGIEGGKNCTITGNTCNNNAVGIYLNNSENCTATGNTCLRGGGTSSDYTSSQNTFYTNSGTTNCVIVGNNCSGKAPTVAGTGNIVENNLS